MRPRLVLFILSLFIVHLSACAPAPVYVSPLSASAPANPYAPSLQDAQRAIDSATNTAVVEATHNAQATATRVARLEAVADSWTATAVQFQFDQTRAAQTAALAAVTQSANQTSVAATATLAAQSAQATSTQARAEVETTNAVQNGDTFRSVLWAAVVVFAIVLVLGVGGAYVIMRDNNARHQARRQREHELELKRQEAVHETEVMKLRLMAIIATGRETGAGTLLLGPDGRPMLLPPAQPVTGGELLDRAMSQLPPLEPEPEVILVNNPAESHTVSRLSPDELAAQGRMIEFLEAAITFYNQSNLSGERQTKIPSAPRYLAAGLKRWGSGDTWQTHRNLFGSNLVSGPKGTFCPPAYPTLGSLLNATRKGYIRACLPQSVAQGI